MCLRSAEARLKVHKKIRTAKAVLIFLCLRRFHFFRQRKGMFRALGHGSLLAAAPKVTKNAA